MNADAPRYSWLRVSVRISASSPGLSATKRSTTSLAQGISSMNAVSIGSEHSPVAVHDLAADHRDQHLGIPDLVLWASQDVAVQHDQVGELADLQRALDLLLERHPGAAHRVHPDRLSAGDPLLRSDHAGVASAPGDRAPDCQEDRERRAVDAACQV